MDNLNALRVVELRTRLKSLGVEFKSSMRKAGLVQLLQEALDARRKSTNTPAASSGTSTPATTSTANTPAARRSSSVSRSTRRSRSSARCSAPSGAPKPLTGASSTKERLGGGGWGRVCALMGVVGVGVFAALYQHIRSLPRINLPKHMLGHPVVYKDQLISPEQGDSLRQLFRDIAPFPTNNADLNFYKTVHEHIGEAVPMGEDGSCPHHYLLPSRDGTLCHLPGRIDIGRHFIKTGGARGLRETFDVMKSRLMSFGSYNFNLTAYPQMSDLFTSPSFTEAAQKVCPADKKHLDPFQFNFIVNLPGQSVATHVDGVYFWGASRFQVPQWLLAAMKFSGLWEDVFVDQVQVVGYLHKWDPTSFPHHEDAGQFLYWDSNDPEPKVVQPKPLAGSVVDGSKTIHSAAVYRVGSRPPVMQKGRTHYLAHVEGEDWVVQSQADGGDIIANYTFDDLRISIVYRARCFADEEEAARFRAQMEGPTGEDGRTTLEQILSTFVENLITRGVYQEGTTLDDLDRFSLATTILDTYIAYPLPNNRDIPLNYCALPRELPWTAPFINLICP